MLADLTFPHSYEINLDVWLPPYTGSSEVYYYPGARLDGGNDGTLLEITPDQGNSWMGMFASGSWGGISGVYSCPDGQSFCVLSIGMGYIVRAEDPLNWEEISVSIREVKVLAEQHLLVFRDVLSLFAYGPNGLEWAIERLALDELTIDCIEGNILRGHATVPGGRHDEGYVTWSEYEVDVLTGNHKGGMQWE